MTKCHHLFLIHIMWDRHVHLKQSSCIPFIVSQAEYIPDLFEISTLELHELHPRKAYFCPGTIKGDMMTSTDKITCIIDVYLVTWIPFSYKFMKITKVVTLKQSSYFC